MNFLTQVPGVGIKSADRLIKMAKEYFKDRPKITEEVSESPEEETEETIENTEEAD